MWVDAECQSDADFSDWYAAGVAMTCRWMATATVFELGRAQPAMAPVTHQRARAYEELIAKELFAAQRLSLRRPVPEWLTDQPRWLEAVIATLEWAWSRSGVVPLVGSAGSAG